MDGQEPGVPVRGGNVVRSSRSRRMREWLSRSDSGWADLARAFLLYLATRALLAAFVWLTASRYTFGGARTNLLTPFPDNLLLNALFQWDAGHYLSIISDGYSIGALDYDTNATFFPGFPVFAWLVGKLVGGAHWGGLVVNHLASIGAAGLVAGLARELRIAPPGGDADRTAREATLFWMAAPLTLFFCVFLSESLFAFATVALFWSVVRARWGWALVAGIVATATRSFGMVAVGAAFLLAWERRGERPVPKWAWMCLVATPLGLLAFCVHQAAVLGDPLAWMHLQGQWGRHLMWPWETVDAFHGLPGLDVPTAGHDLLRVDQMYQTQEIMALGLLLPFLAVRRRLGIPWSIWLLGLAQWILPLCTGVFTSAARFQAGNLYFALAIPALLAHWQTLRSLIWLGFGLALAWYASTYPFGAWAT